MGDRVKASVLTYGLGGVAILAASAVVGYLVLEIPQEMRDAEKQGMAVYVDNGSGVFDDKVYIDCEEPNAKMLTSVNERSNANAVVMMVESPVEADYTACFTAE